MLVRERVTGWYKKQLVLSDHSQPPTSLALGYFTAPWGNGQGRGHPRVWGAVIYHLKTVSALPNCWHETPMASTM